jgi:hypothetical protein
MQVDMKHRWRWRLDSQRLCADATDDAWMSGCGTLLQDSTISSSMLDIYYVCEYYQWLRDGEYIRSCPHSTSKCRRGCHLSNQTWFPFASCTSAMLVARLLVAHVDRAQVSTLSLQDTAGKTAWVLL